MKMCVLMGFNHEQHEIIMVIKGKSTIWCGFAHISVSWSGFKNPTAVKCFNSDLAHNFLFHTSLNDELQVKTSCCCWKIPCLRVRSSMTLPPHPSAPRWDVRAPQCWWRRSRPSGARDCPCGRSCLAFQKYGYIMGIYWVRMDIMGYSYIYIYIYIYIYTYINGIDGDYNGDMIWRDIFIGWNIMIYHWD